MTDREERERLIELLKGAETKVTERLSAPLALEEWLGIYADHLLANGVIVPPCKVGDTVWFNTFKKNATVCVGIQPHIVDRIDVNCVCDTKNLIETSIPCWTFGKTVFLTKEEAEKALAERIGE